MQETDTLIIGASISGLACAAALQKSGIPCIVIEKGDEIASPWYAHYDRLHLHTNKRLSSLPFRPMPSHYPRYPSRQQVLDYLEDYRAHFNIRPQFATTAIAVHQENNDWMTSTTRGHIRSKHVIVATGPFGKPRTFSISGLENFSGSWLHSAAYKTGSVYKDKEVLVVGFGNSACEIAIDLFEQGARPSMSVRSPVNVIPRDVLGIPVLELSLLMRRLPPRMADAISAPLMRLLTGRLTAYGLQRKGYGPLEQISRDASTPVLDIGVLRHIRLGHIPIYTGIDRMEGNRVVFTDGSSHCFDSIVAAVGYERNYTEFLPLDKSRIDDLRKPVHQQQFFGKDGLYFCGYWLSPAGQIREIASDAKLIAKHISAGRPFV